jgi:pimeloyl-ACP methyl ester carboxylesterase
MSHVISNDGTTIAYDRQGDGPAVILATGALDDGTENAPLATELAAHFTVYNYNRRGRGDSGDTQPYALEREIEDLDALIAEAGGSAHLYGVSSGGGLVLEAAAAGLAVERLAVYEVPYMVSDVMRQAADEYVGHLHAALAEGRRSDAGELFMRLAGSPDEQIEEAKSSPYWPGVMALAPTLAYDAACCRSYHPPTDLLATVTQPTLVATGGSVDVFEQAADLIAATVPNAERRVISGMGHVVDATTFAPVLKDFLNG